MEFATVAGALKHLDVLGSSAAIADELEARGIRSTPGCPETCAVADYITTAVDVYGVTVDGDEAFGTYQNYAAFREVLSHPVHQFVIEFDRGEFPTLIASGAQSVIADWSDLEDVA